MKEASVTSFALKPPQSWVARVIWTWSSGQGRSEIDSQSKKHLVVHIEPLRVVVHLVRLEGDPRHEPPGLVEI